MSDVSVYPSFLPPVFLPVWKNLLIGLAKTFGTRKGRKGRIRSLAPVFPDTVAVAVLFLGSSAVLLSRVALEGCYVVRSVPR